MRSSQSSGATSIWTYPVCARRRPRFRQSRTTKPGGKLGPRSHAMGSSTLVYLATGPDLSSLWCRCSCLCIVYSQWFTVWSTCNRITTTSGRLCTTSTVLTASSTQTTLSRVLLDLFKLIMLASLSTSFTNSDAHYIICTNKGFRVHETSNS